MTQRRTATTPEPEKPSRWNRRFLVRASLAGLAGVAVVVLGLVVMSSFRPRPIAGIGGNIRYEVMRPWIRELPLERRVTESWGGPANDAVWVSAQEWKHVRDIPMKLEAGEIVGACGCRFAPQHLVRTWSEPSVVYLWNCWPREDATVRVVLHLPAGDRTFTLDNSARVAPPAPPNRPLEALPWTQEIDGVRYSVRAGPGAAGPVVVFSLMVPSQPAHTRRPHRMAFRDAKGNTWEQNVVAMDEHEREVFGNADLCRHAAWWEMTITPFNDAPVTVRFPTPR